MRPARLSPLTWRLLVVNSLPLLFLLIGFIYSGVYRSQLMDRIQEALSHQTQIFVSGLAVTAVTGETKSAKPFKPELREDIAVRMIQKIVETTGIHAFLYDQQGRSIIKSTDFLASLGKVDIPDPPPDFIQKAMTYDVQRVIEKDHRPYFYAAAPIRRYGDVFGVLVLAQDDKSLQESIKIIQDHILRLFIVSLLATMAISFFFARTISQPMQNLVKLADILSQSKGRDHPKLASFIQRRDEIGHLSRALQRMTEELWRRIHATERFAADVAHELKNPIASLQSALETYEKIKQPEKRETLLRLMHQDLQRMDRLISDITFLSKMDAEMVRDRHERIDLVELLQDLITVYRTTMIPDGPEIIFEFDSAKRYRVLGVKDTLVLVIKNVLDNAISFTPIDKSITMKLDQDRHFCSIRIQDQGPGLQSGSEEKIFERFYSTRMNGRKDQNQRHSGLGLSLCRQIIDAHQGYIKASNQYNKDGKLIGACFTIKIPTT